MTFNEQINKEKELTNWIVKKLTERGDKDIIVSNVKFINNNAMTADVSYTWFLNAWAKLAEHKDMILSLSTTSRSKAILIFLA